jgi:5-dehydro-2-deoxygluconokinase
MSLGYDKPLYVLAFDHRSSFSKGLFGATEPLSPEIQAKVSDTKDLIFEAFEQAIARGAPRELAGALVDEQFGSAVARKVKLSGALLAMPVERSGQAEFQLEYGEDFGRHIEAFDPDFSKVLVRYNPEGDRELNQRQTGRLARLSDWLHARQRKLLFELLVPATPAQLARSGGQERYDRELRASLVVETLRELQQGGVEPDIWKVAGFETPAECAGVVEQARSGTYAWTSRHERRRTLGANGDEAQGMAPAWSPGRRRRGNEDRDGWARSNGRQHDGTSPGGGPAGGRLRSPCREGTSARRQRRDRRQLSRGPRAEARAASRDLAHGAGGGGR